MPISRALVITPEMNKAAPVAKPFEIVENPLGEIALEDTMKKNSWSPNLQTAMTLGILAVSFTCDPNFNPPADVKDEDDDQAPDQDDEEEPTYDSIEVFDEFVALFEVASRAAHRWVGVLVSSEQNKSQKRSNISNYFKSTGTKTVPHKAVDLVSYLAANLGALKSRDWFNMERSRDKYMMYHTSYSSTPGLIQKVIEEVGIEDYFSEEEIATVMTAVEDTTDSKLSDQISPMTIAKAKAYLEGVGFDFGDWYQAERAQQSVSATKYMQLVKLHKLREKKRYNMEGLADADADTIADNIASLAN